MIGKILKRLVFGMAGLIGVGFFLPGSTHFDRRIDVSAAAPVVYQQINELKNWTNWSPWAHMDPNTRYEYNPQTSAGLGAWNKWSSTVTGNGKMTIVEAKEPENVKVKLAFDGQGEAVAEFKFMAKDSSHTQIIWSFSSEHGLNPFSRWFGVFTERFLSPDYEKGLANIKAYSEK
jgi:hypothetical protein